ncbi:MAG: ATPase [Moraxellaceae bacterium]|nr:MAG: ATPase [Moraxellaceae bacterium]
MMLKNNPKKPTPSLISIAIAIIFGLFLSACGSSDETGQETVNPPASNNTTGEADPTSLLIAYNASGKPAAATDDVQAFMQHLWSNVVEDNRCGACHNASTAQSPLFARDDDVNAAYNAVLGSVNLDSPSSSLLVTQVTAGHNCWTATTAECAADMTLWITNWAADSNGIVSNEVVLIAPDVHEVDNTKVLPDIVPGSYSALHTLLVTNCASCHVESAANAQSPFFASSNLQDSFDAVRSKIDLADEDRTLTGALSRIVVRLRSESHNCFSASCSSDATELLTAIQAIASGIDAQVVDPALEISKGLQLGIDGLPANTGGRHETAMIARWEFKEGSGFSSRDSSGIQPLMDLQFSGDVSWVGGWGINLNGGRAQATTLSSRKLYDKIAETAEYSIEAWIAPNNVTQEGPARIISYSAGNENSNFLLGQTLYNYDFLHRSENSDDTGNPALSTADADERLQASQQHVVVTYSAQNGRRIYVNGVFTGDEDPSPSTSLADWSNSYQFILGTAESNFSWLGVIRMVTIHNRELTQEQITQNFDVGVGQKFLLLFNVTDLVEIDDCWDSFIVFEAAEYDSYSYLFNQPYFARLYTKQEEGDGISAACMADAAPAQDAINFSITDMRLGINGKIEPTGQGFQNISVNVTADLQVLSTIGTIFNQQNGVNSDQFFLAFGNIAGKNGAYTDPTSITPAAPVAGVMPEEFGLRTFDEINASLATMITVASTTPVIASLYEEIKQQLPVDETLGDFVPAHQMAIAQIAMLYCSELVNDTTKRDAYFPGFDFSAAPNVAFDDAAKRNLIYNPLLSHMSDTTISTNISLADLADSLDILLDGIAGRTGLTDCSGSCDATRTQTVVKAMCAVTAASATMLIQ